MRFESQGGLVVSNDIVKRSKRAIEKIDWNGQHESSALGIEP